MYHLFCLQEPITFPWWPVWIRNITDLPDIIDNASHVRSDNNAWMLSGRTHCTGRNVRMGWILHFVHLRSLHHWMTFTKSLNKVPITTFSRRCKAGLMPLTRMLWPSANIIMHLNFLALQCCLSFFTNGGITFCSGRWSVNRPDTQYAWNTRSYKVLWKKPNLPMKGMILSSCIKWSPNTVLVFVPNVYTWREKMANFLHLWKRQRHSVIHHSLHLTSPVQSLNLKRP